MAATRLPEAEVLVVKRWSEQRVPEHIRDRLRVECHIAARYLTIVERRPLRTGDTESEWAVHPVARLRFTKKTGLWTLYWCDHSGQFHRYEQHAPSPRVSYLLRELEHDPTALFWG
jgi:hypothetical protein